MVMSAPSDARTYERDQYRQKWLDALQDLKEHKDALEYQESRADKAEAAILELALSLQDTFFSASYWYKKSNQEWNGEASTGSTFGIARALIEKYVTKK